MKASHTLKIAFQHVMEDVNEISSEYNVDVIKIDKLNNSPHYWDKRVAYLTRHVLKAGLWTLDDGLWTLDAGRWTMDGGPFHFHSINHFVTS